MDYWETHKGTAAPITVEMIRKAFQKIEDSYFEPCMHVVGPRAEGWSTCAFCFQPVFVPEARIK